VLTSPPFVIGAARISFLIGGNIEDSRARIELLTPVDAIDEKLFGSAVPGVEVGIDIEGVRYMVRAEMSAGTDERMQRHRFDVGEWNGEQARLRIIDRARSGHINVDDIRCEDISRAEPAPVWGMADLHAHWAAHRGLGEKVLWGSPGGNHASSDPRLDLASCDGRGHAGGLAAGRALHQAEYGTADAVSHAGRTFGADEHAGLGAGVDWPSYRSLIHQQMHVSAVRRAYLGGLRLMVTSAIDSAALQFLMGSVLMHRAHPSRPGEQTNAVLLESETTAILRQIEEVERLVCANADWMELALTPADARRIINHGKLAIVLGVEVDGLGRLLLPGRGRVSVSDEVAFLSRRGVRQVTPIHLVDNDLGGAALYADLFNVANDFFHNGCFPGTTLCGGVTPVHYFPGGALAWDLNFTRFFMPEAASCERGACVSFRLQDPTQRLVLGNTLGHWFPSLQSTLGPRYPSSAGHINSTGLSAQGRDYVNALRAAGILVDVDHASQKATDELLGTASAPGILAHCGPVVGGGPCCGSEACWESAYPALSSHSTFRTLGLWSSETPRVDHHAHEGQKLTDQALRIAYSGGMLAPIPTTADVRSARAWIGAEADTVANDCAGSSKSWAQSYLFATRVAGDRNVGIGSDMNGLVAHSNPRFGEFACRGGGLDHPRSPRERETFHPNWQRNAVRYRGGSGVSETLVAPAAVQAHDLEPYAIGSRVFTINNDGLAHYGMIPDFIQDVKNAGAALEQLGPLFRSAEDYIRAWEKARRLGCGDRCPSSPPLACR
jgi:microsomal dipeptidase-like Zn-dependent dipeptidase